MGKKLQILFSCSFLFHLTHLKVAMLGKCLIQLLGCSHLPQWSQEGLIPAKPECKEHLFQSFYSHLTASHCSWRDALMCKASPIPPRGQPAPLAVTSLPFTVLPFTEQEPHLDWCILLGGSCSSSSLGCWKAGSPVGERCAPALLSWPELPQTFQGKAVL